MQEIKAQIVEQRIISSSIFISEDLSKKFEFSMQCKAKLKTSKNEEDKSVLLNIELTISTKDEKFNVKFVSFFIFKLDQLPDDYDNIAEEKLIPMAREALLDSLDEMLVTMGYSKMELAKRMCHET